MTDCLIAFGGNLSNPKVTFQLGLEALSDAGFKLTHKSGLWRSPAWPAGSKQPEYLNAVVRGRYEGDAHRLMQELLSIETKHGRVRSVPNAARTLDLDLLVFGDLEFETKTLTLPHPLMLKRAFVLVPASEVDPKWVSHTRDLPVSDIRALRYAGSW